MELLTCQPALCKCVSTKADSYGPHFLVFPLILVMLIAKQPPPPQTRLTCSIFIQLLKHFLSLAVSACAPDFSRLINISAAVYSRYKSPMFNSYFGAAARLFCALAGCVRKASAVVHNAAFQIGPVIWLRFTSERVWSAHASVTCWHSFLALSNSISHPTDSPREQVVSEMSAPLLHGGPHLPTPRRALTCLGTR